MSAGLPPDLSNLLAGLNPMQQEAVLHGDGPLLIFAGAGSGKTRVLTHRIAHLVRHRGVDPARILAVTFTNKASKEIQERLNRLLGSGLCKEMWCGTFHSTCARILRERGTAIGLPRDFTVYDDDDQMTLVKECLHQLNLDDRQFAPRALLAGISRAKEKLISPEDYPLVFKGFFEGVVGKVYSLYQGKLRINKALDFDDLIGMTVRLLEQREDVRYHYQTKFTYVLVDEYQDVNRAQYRLTRLLAGRDGRIDDPNANLCVVGDDDQGIYGWRGADVDIILGFEQDHPGCAIVHLEQNYRSTKTILDAAWNVVRHNRSRKEKRLWTDNHDGELVRVVEAMNEQDEAARVAGLVRQMSDHGTRRLGDIAILYRTNAQSRVLEEAFLNYRIPYQIVGGLRFYERREVKDLLAYLRVIANPWDSVSLRRIVNVPARGLGSTSLAHVDRHAAQRGIALWDALSELDSVEGLRTAARKNLTEFKALLESFRSQAAKLGVSGLSDLVLKQSGYRKALETEQSIEAQGRLENLDEFLTVTAQYEATTENPGLTGFLEQAALISDIDTMGDGSSAVTLMTLHSAKGLEFPVVFLIGMEEGIFPHFRSLQQDGSIEEERRLAYVGITRAREELHLSYAIRRAIFGQTQMNPPSRFIKEIPTELWSNPPSRSGLGSWGQERRAAESTWERPTPKPVPTETAPPFRAGEKVKHAVFGQGVVVQCTGSGDDAVVSVAFPNIGVKKLVVGFARLTKA
jgi:DNA helicase-2/ATP-dependent DNA helicase PcrA